MLPSHAAAHLLSGVGNTVIIFFWYGYSEAHC